MSCTGISLHLAFKQEVLEGFFSLVAARARSILALWGVTSVDGVSLDQQLRGDSHSVDHAQSDVDRVEVQ